MPGLWGIWRTPSLPLLLSPLWPGVVAPDCQWLVGWLVLWHINLCRLFNAKSVFMEIVSSISNKSNYMSTLFNCQKHLYFNLFSLFKQF